MISRHLVLLLLLTVNVCSVTLMTFDEFIVKFNKNYTQGSEEYNQKKKIFDFNVEQLKAKNCEACGVTKFFDVASEEFKKSTTCFYIRILESGISRGENKLGTPIE